MKFTLNACLAAAMAKYCSAWDGNSLAELMNQEFHSFNADDNTSGYGLYLRFAEDPNIYCHGDCYGGKPDCKISGSIINDKQMMYLESGKLALTFGKATAWYVNTTLVRTKLAKCSFAWDGGTDVKNNGGCGGYRPGVCSDPNSAYHNMCDGQPCTDKSEEVVKAECVNRPQSEWPTSWGMGPNCFWKGPAFYPPAGSFADETHTMMNQRVKFQSSKDDFQWNEMVLDGDQLLKEMGTDAVATIPAIVYNPAVHGLPYAQQTAKRVAQEMQTKYKMAAQPILIMIDTTVDARDPNSKPFVFQEFSEADVVV